MLKLFATICSLTSPFDCHQEQVTTTELDPRLTGILCPIAEPSLATWLEQWPGYRLAGWKCQIGNRGASL